MTNETKINEPNIKIQSVHKRKNLQTEHYSITTSSENVHTPKLLRGYLALDDTSTQKLNDCYFFI